MTSSNGKNATLPTPRGRRPSRSTLELLARLKSGEILPLELTISERRSCVEYLKLEGYGQTEIAQIFGVSRHTISRDEKVISEQHARAVREVDRDRVAGGHLAWARHLMSKAVRNQDFALAWRIQRELMSDLQALGILPKAPEQHEVRELTLKDLVERFARGERSQDSLEPPDKKALPAPSATQTDDVEKSCR